VLYALGVYNEAAKIYQAGLERKPDHTAGYFALANCWFRLGAHEAAAAVYNHVLALDPSHRAAAANLALTQEQIGQKAA
jgi:tetratricopeptide (TPR) repeat protein